MNSTTPLLELLDAYCELHSLSAASRMALRSTVVSFAASLGRAAKLGDLNAATLDSWADELETRLARSTCKFQRKWIRTLWRFAATVGALPAGPPEISRKRLSEAERIRRERRQQRQPKAARQWPYDGKKILAMKTAPAVAMPTIGPATTVADYYRGVYLRMKLSVRSVRTKLLYLNTLRLFDKFLGRPATLADLNDETVTIHLGWIIEIGRQPRTANKSRDQLLAVWRYAARKRHVENFPDVEPVSEYKRAPTAWTIDQLAILIDTAKRTGPGGLKGLREKTMCGIPFDVWWVALLLTLYDSGIRIGAAMQLRCEDFDAANCRLFVRAETQKQRADQILPLSGETAAALVKCIAATERELLFPWPYALSYLYGHLNRLLKASGLPTGRRDKFHKIRRTSATMAELYIGPGAATVHLGHSSPAVTERYLDRTMLPAANVAAALPRPTMKGGAA